MTLILRNSTTFVMLKIIVVITGCLQDRSISYFHRFAVRHATEVGVLSSGTSHIDPSLKHRGWMEPPHQVLACLFLDVANAIKDFEQTGNTTPLLQTTVYTGICRVYCTRRCTNLQTTVSGDLVGGTGSVGGSDCTTPL